MLDDIDLEMLRGIHPFSKRDTLTVVHYQKHRSHGMKCLIGLENQGVIKVPEYFDSCKTLAGF